jgi:hypothetical protein
MDRVQDLFGVKAKEVLPDIKQGLTNDIKDYSKLMFENDVLSFKMTNEASMEDAEVDENASKYGDHTKTKLETVPIPDKAGNKLTMSRTYTF